MENCFVKNITSNCDPDMSDKAIQFYKCFFKNYFENDQIIPYYRGDCMNSLGWTFGINNKEGIFKSHRSYTRLFKKEDIDLFYQFRNAYHSKANFIILPYELNIMRGEYRVGDNDNYGYGSCDYFDILLNLIKKHYFNEKMSERMLRYVEPYKKWLNLYGQGTLGWKNFINKNYLLPFVNKDYLVKDIFADSDIYKDNQCKELVGQHHDFDWCLPRCSKNEEEIPLKVAKERAVNYMKNCLWIWNERAALLSKELITQ